MGNERGEERGETGKIREETRGARGSKDQTGEREDVRWIPGVLGWTPEQR